MYYQRKIHFSFKTQFLLFAIVCFFTNLSSVAEATLRNRIVTCLEVLKSTAVNTLTRNYALENGGQIDGEYLLGSEWHPFKAHATNRLGFGTTGSAYLLQDISGFSYLSEPNRVLPVQTVIKMPHQFKWTDVTAYGGNLSNQREVEIYRAIQEQFPGITESKEYPKDSPWKPGAMPTAEILGDYATKKQGHVIIKPFLKGMNLKDIWTTYQPETFSDLPLEMQQDLKIFYELIQAMHDNGRVQERNYFSGEPLKGKTEKLSLDINPTNITWVSDPETMKVVGLERSGFMAYELGRMPGQAWHASNMPWNIYQQMFISFIRSRGLKGIK